ncbi:MAG: hypothetical protein LBV72_13780 [Tannerella sp.]|jgi:hypothetical protein|nr:hypothetical protein [Tannerella sp.]
MKKSILLFLFITVIGWTMQAQRPPIEHDPEKIAQMQTDMLDRELSLTKKQRKKVYKLYLKQAREMQAGMKAGHPDIAPPMMMGGGREPGGMGGEGERRPDRGPGGGPDMGHRQQAPPDRNGLNDASPMPGEKQMINEESPEQIEALEKKMQKILKPNQFVYWQKAERERRILLAPFK